MSHDTLNPVSEASEMKATFDRFVTKFVEHSEQAKQLPAIKDDLAKVRSEIYEMRQEITKAREEINTLVAERDMLRSERDRLRNELDGANDVVNTYSNDLTVARQRIADLEKANEVEKGIAKGLERDLEEMRTSRNSWQDRYYASDRNLVEECNAHIDTQRERDALQASLDKIRSVFEDKAKAITEALESTKAEPYSPHNMAYQELTPKPADIQF